MNTFERSRHSRSFRHSHVRVYAHSMLSAKLRPLLEESKRVTLRRGSQDFMARVLGHHSVFSEVFDRCGKEDGYRNGHDTPCDKCPRHETSLS